MSRHVEHMKLRVLVAACALTVGATGCESKDSSADTGSTDTDPLRANVQAYSDAFLTGDADTAYGLLSDRCRQRVSQSAFKIITTAAKTAYGSALPIETFDADVQSSLARVTYTYSDSKINQTDEPWVQENGEWHEDDCASVPTTQHTKKPKVGPAGIVKPNVGARALGLGEWREGEDVRTRVVKFVQADQIQPPSYLQGMSDAEGALANIQMCVRKSSNVSFHEFPTGLFHAYDKNGGQYSSSSVSWTEWPPRPQLPSEINLPPGRCVQGWVLFSVPKNTRILTVDEDGFDDAITVAQWRMDQ